MTDEKKRAAQSMLKDTDTYLFISGIIKALNLSRTTFYCHFPPERIQGLREGF